MTVLRRVSYTELVEPQDEERSSIGVGIRGLSGITEDLPPDTLVRVESVSEFSPLLSTPLLVVVVVLVMLPPLVVLPALLPVLPLLLSIPEIGLERVAGLCFSRLSRRVGEAWIKNVSKSACWHTVKLLGGAPASSPAKFWSAQATPFSPSAAWRRSV